MGLIARVGDKAGALGSVVSAMGCAGCFPALGSLGMALGLGFLNQYEGLFITVLLPLFAALALLANALGWLSHRQWHRSVLGMVGPVIVLFATYTMAEKLLYAGLAIMIGVSVWDLLAPAHRRCAPDVNALPRRQ
ncbi:mercury transport protein MerC [Variovorax boronicumulans]|uniref:Mercury transport protein MerC n=1 Tax=Variovorax boronicumulans TaxID=436515 RepID=A0A250DPI0_9BURK|nr:organomercurial transporter MerC [Variovorax boronicumulans]ATA56172.1 mercury transport protein MerC [Variovorax boronicumulans]